MREVLDIGCLMECEMTKGHKRVKLVGVMTQGESKKKWEGEMVDNQERKRRGKRRLR